MSWIRIHPIPFHSRYHEKFRFQKILLPTPRLSVSHSFSHNISLCNLLNSSALIWYLYWWSNHSSVLSVICFSVGFRPNVSSARTNTDTAGPTVSRHAAEGCTAQRSSYESKDNWHTSCTTLPDKKKYLHRNRVHRMNDTKLHYFYPYTYSGSSSTSFSSPSLFSSSYSSSFSSSSSQIHAVSRFLSGVPSIFVFHWRSTFGFPS